MESFTEKNIPNELGKIPLTVILIKKDDCWVALGVETYYVAYGKTVDDTKSNFEEGLMLTLNDPTNSPEAIKRFLDKKMPNDIFEKYLALKENWVQQKNSTNEKFEFDYLAAA